MSIIKLSNVSKFYYNKMNISSGFTKINLELNMGEFVVITGESGSGKSTLLNVISGLDSYEEGEMYINGEETSHYNEVDYENYRRKYIGNIFQNFNLVNSYTVYQNVELALLLNGYKKRNIRRKILDIIETVGLTKYKNTKASKLSGGQKQRVAIARALAKDTPIIVADEPTGNLDVQSARQIMKLLKEISANKLVVIVTHNYEQVAEYATRKISMNDGKIIEDKKISKYERVEAEEVKYKDLTFFNKILLGFRNAFNIKTKFILLFLVYFCVTFLVFSEYSSLAKQNYDDSLIGYNPYFNGIEPERVILKKKDNSVFNDSEIEKLKNLDGVDRVERSDLLLDMYAEASNDELYFSGKLESFDKLKNLKLTAGRMPEADNEVVISSYDMDYYRDSLGDNLFNQVLTLSDTNNYRPILDVKLVGVIENDNFGLASRTQIFVSDNVINSVNIGLSSGYSSLELTIDNKIYSKDGSSNNIWFNIEPSKKVPREQMYLFSDLSPYCHDYNCQDKKIGLRVFNLYYDDNREFTVKKIITKDNFKTEIGQGKWEDSQSTIYINEDEYKEMFYKGDYQVSVFLKSTKNGNDVVDKLKVMGYDTYYMKDNLINSAAEMLGVLNILKSVVYIGATIALFFISYFIIKIILKSRNIYYSTIRILGASKKIATQLLNIELFVDINIAYIVFLMLIFLAKSEIIEWQYVKDLITYFNFGDYIAIYIILAVMSLLISNRYAHKLFKNSAMHTYREEV